MKTLIQTLFCILLFSNIQGQVSWTGLGDGHTWDDGNNWSSGLEPADNDVVTIAATVTIDGTANNNPARITIEANNAVTLALDLDIGNGAVTEHGVKVQGNAHLFFGDGINSFTFNLNQPTNREGLLHDGGGMNSTMTIAANATVNVTGARDAVEVATGNTLTVNGTLNIDGPNSDGFFNEGTINNQGIITINSANVIGINNAAGGNFTNGGSIVINDAAATTTDGINTEGTFTNNSFATIDVNGMTDDGIEILGGSTFTNNGTLNTFTESSPITNNVGLAVGSATSAGILINNGTINADGGGTGSNDNRAIQVYSMGSITNNSIINLLNSQNARSFWIEGSVTNNKGAVIEQGVHRVRVVGGTLTNNSLMKSTFSGTGVFAPSGTAINNAFYDYTASAFASGGGMIFDYGININPTFGNTTIDAGTSCTVDLAEVPCQWFYNGNSIGTADVMGMLTLPDDTFESDPSNITNNDIPGNTITLTIENFCQQALPIDLVKFEVNKLDKATVSIEWATATEINSDYVSVMRSSNGQEWEEINTVYNQADSYTLRNYSFIDKSPQAGVNYYKLKQVDLDGSIEYSETKMVKMLELNRFTLTPNSVNVGNNVVIDMTNLEDRAYEIVAYDLNGRMYELGSYIGGNMVTVEINSLTKGMYIIGMKSSITAMQKLMVF